MNMLSFPTRRVRALLLLGWLLFSIPGLMPTRPAKAQTSETFEITLVELGYDEQTLQGPMAGTRYFFSLPADWEMQPDSYLELNLNYTISGDGGRAPTSLEVQLNGTVLQTSSFETPGVHQIRVELPPDVLRSPEDEYLNELQLNLLVSTTCEEAQLTSLVIDASSSLHFVYMEKPLQLDLALWPRPLYQWQAFEPGQTRLVLPPEPDETDVRAAIMVAARLGRLSNDNLPLTAALASERMPSSLLAEHLIVVGRPDTNPLLHQLDLPVPLAQRQLKLHSRMPASVAPGHVFSYTLTVENISSESQTLVVEDRISSNGTLLNCLGRCQESEPGVLRWDVGRVAAGRQVSTTVSLRLDPATPPGEQVEHTASLLDSTGTVINVDTLAANVGTTETGQMTTSAHDKSPYFFVHDNRGVAEGDGLVQALVSPWSPRHAVIVVTGLSDEALLKAAHALSTKTRLPGMSGVYALVEAVQPPPDTTTEESAENVSLAALGYGDSVLNGAIFETIQYTFDVPGGWALTQDSYLALHFAHSVALSAMSATLEIQLNDVPIGSIRLDEQNASGTWSTLLLPVPLQHPGRNRLLVQVGARRDGVCVDLRNTHLWLTIYADSFLHLPHEKRSLALYLESFPQPFSSVGDLSDVAFLLPARPTVEELEGVLRLASRLGDVARGDSFRPRVALGESPQTQLWEGHDLIAVGRPTNNPFIAAVNDRLPQPFRPGMDEIQQQVDNVVYRLPPWVSLGYVQELLSPWDENQAMLVTTGTTDEGVDWALNALVDDRLKWRLAGNLVLVRGDEIETVDTRGETESATQITRAFVPELTPQATVAPTPTPIAAPTTPATIPTTAIGTLTPSQAAPQVSTGRPMWLLPLLIAAVIAAAVGIGITLRQGKS